MHYLFMNTVPDKRKKGLSAQAVDRFMCDTLVSERTDHSIEKPLDFLVDHYALRLDSIPMRVHQLELARELRMTTLVR